MPFLTYTTTWKKIVGGGIFKESHFYQNLGCCLFPVQPLVFHNQKKVCNTPSLADLIFILIEIFNSFMLMQASAISLLPIHISFLVTIIAVVRKSAIGAVEKCQDDQVSGAGLFCKTAQTIPNRLRYYVKNLCSIKKQTGKFSILLCNVYWQKLYLSSFSKVLQNRSKLICKRGEYLQTIALLLLK